MISCQKILLPSTRIISSLKTKYPVTGNNFTNKSTGFSIQISCEQLQISCLQCRHVDGDLRGLGTGSRRVPRVEIVKDKNPDRKSYSLDMAEEL